MRGQQKHLLRVCQCFNELLCRVGSGRRRDLLQDQAAHVSERVAGRGLDCHGLRVVLHRGYHGLDAAGALHGRQVVGRAARAQVTKRQAAAFLQVTIVPKDLHGLDNDGDASTTRNDHTVVGVYGKVSQDAAFFIGWLYSGNLLLLLWIVMPTLLLLLLLCLETSHANRFQHDLHL